MTAFSTPSPIKSIIALVVCLLVLAGAVVTASLAQRDFGRVTVSDVYYRNFNGIPIRAKLFRPMGATEQSPAPGVVYIHGYQNNRETGDAYSIETARRGIVVLNIDAIGRGHSGIPGDPKEPGFDPTYGGTSSLAFLRSLAFVRAGSTGMMGHSLGAEMAYTVALADSSVRALVITGYAYTAVAGPAVPRNMLMIIGRYDEFRKRMTGVGDIEKEWMGTEQTRRVFPVPDPKLGVTYGNFAKGTARRVVVPPISHVHESHSSEAIAETVEWLRQSLRPDPSLWVDAKSQVWLVKELATLLAMCAAFALLFPLGALLLKAPFFRPLENRVTWRHAAGTADYLKYASVNGLLLWLYIPLILVIFGLHKFVVRIDRAFPMMMVNAVVWWLLVVNLIGLLLYRRWYRRRAARSGITLLDLGVSFEERGLAIQWGEIGRTLLYSALLFIAMYATEFLAEKLFIVNYRFVWPFFSSLTPYRAGMFLLYLPFILFCFVVTGMFLHGQIRRPAKKTLIGTHLSWTAWNVSALCVPLILLLCVQYVPLYTAGVIPLQGPGGLFAVFMILMVHIVMLVAFTAEISTWFYLLTGRIYAGAILNALIVAWMFASSQVIAPIPV